MNLDVFSPEELAKFNELINNSQQIAICCHKNPDGDALGSSIALMEYLTQKGKNATVIVPDFYPDFLRWLPGTERIVRYDKHKEKADELINKADLLCCLDFNTASRTGEMQEIILSTPAKKLLIDHHLKPEIPTDLCLSRPNASSTSELVFRIVWQNGDYEAQNKHFAAAIYCGLMTDTINFTVNSSRPEIFFIAAKLLEKRINKDKIYRNVFNNYSQWAIRFRGYIMFQKLNVMETQHSAYFIITREDMKRFHFIKGDAEGLVNEALRIKGIYLSISMREDTEKDNVVWVSLRSEHPYFCNEIAEKFFNGGGHECAAGGKLNCSAEEAQQIARKAIEYFYQTTQNNNNNNA